MPSAGVDLQKQGADRVLNGRVIYTWTDRYGSIGEILDDGTIVISNRDTDDINTLEAWTDDAQRAAIVAALSKLPAT